MTGPRRRGLTLVELMLALSVTAMVGLAITGMLDMVSAGVMTHRDVRSTMIRASAAQARIGAYVAPARCVLDVVNGSDVVLWLEDARESGTVHASEVRWLIFDAAAGTMNVHFVRFPEAWSETTRALADQSYPANADWMAVLDFYELSGWTSSMPILDGLASAAVSIDQVAARDSRHVVFDLQLQQETGPAAVQVASSVRLHQPPS